MSEEIPIVIRDGVAADAAFVLSSWLKSYARSDFADLMPGRTYYAGHHALIERLFRRSRVLVAHAPGDPDAILGWACVEQSVGPATVHFLYVKQTYRKLGVARRLLAPWSTEAATYSHTTPVVTALPVPQTWSYDPYAAFR